MADPEVGILAIYVYFPRLYVEQEDLEAADGVPGKYTVGLGQQELAFGSDREDAVSMAMTAAARLLDAWDVPAREIGRIEVGTETGVDRSKSVMSYLAGLLARRAAAEEQQANSEQNAAADAAFIAGVDVAGADAVHGCFGGTAALLHAADWAASGTRWDGRLALVVTTDVAVYEPGSAARATGGAGAAAMLVGRGDVVSGDGARAPPPLALMPPRGSPPGAAHFTTHAYDFYKPHGHALYPVVDGPATTAWYLRAADACAARMAAMMATAAEERCAGHGNSGGGAGTAAASGGGDGREEDSNGNNSVGGGVLGAYDYFVAHAPFNKMVRKGYARLWLGDVLRERHRLLRAGAGGGGEWRRRPLAPGVAEAAAAPPPEVAALPPLSASSGARPPDSSVGGGGDKRLEAALAAASAAAYEAQVAPGAALQRRLGNLYTASLFSGLAGLVCGGGGGGGAAVALEAGRRVLLFSFGSGVQAALLGVRAHGGGGRFTLDAIARNQRLRERLAGRLRRAPGDFNAAMAALRASYGAAPYAPGGDVGELEPDTYYLESIDDRHRRRYERTPPPAGVVEAAAAAAAVAVA